MTSPYVIRTRVPPSVGSCSSLSAFSSPPLWLILLLDFLNLSFFQIVLTEVLRTTAWERRCADEFGTYRYRKYNVHRLIVRLYVFIGLQYYCLGLQQK
jgi:hypothetical protein